MPKGDKGTAAQLWGDVFMTNEVLHDKMKKDGNEHYLNRSNWLTTVQQRGAERVQARQACQEASGKEVHGQEEVSSS